MEGGEQVKWLLIVYSVLTNEYVTFDELPTETTCQSAKTRLKTERRFDPDQGWLSACVLQKKKQGKVPGKNEGFYTCIKPGVGCGAAIKLISLAGHCNALRLYGTQLDCVNRLSNSNYSQSSRTGFFISRASGDTYTWSGADGYKADENSQVLILDRFIKTENGKTTVTAAKGICRFQNPYLRKASVFTCEAQTTEGFVEFSFEHNGSPPGEFVLPFLTASTKK